MSEVYVDVRAERHAQDREWGSEHDDQHTHAEWVALLTRHLGLSVDDGDVSSERFRKQMVRVAALAIAAVESFDRRNPAQKIAGPVSTGSGY